MKRNVVRSRGGFSQIDCVYLTAFVRRRERDGASNIVEGDKGEENMVVDEAHVVDDEAYPRWSR